MSRFSLSSFSVAALLLLAQQSAWAHAHPVTMTPAADAVGAAPQQVSMRFTESLEPALSSLEVDDAQGKKVNQAASVVDSAAPTNMHVALPALGSGRYTVKWTAVATDGHRTHGSYHFKVQ